MINYVKDPHTAIFSGPTSCGKTQRVLDLIETEYNQHFENVIILCPTLRWNKTYFKVRNFRCQKLSRFRVFWPFPRKLIPRNVSKYFIRESLFPRNFSLFSNFSYFSFFESFSGDIYLETLITQLFDTFH